MFTLTWVHTCLIDFLQEDAAGMKCLAEVIPCSDSTSHCLVYLFMLLPPRLCAKTIHTPVGREYKKNVPRAVVGFDMFVGWQFLRDEYDEILLILTQGRKQPLTSCTNQTRPQISYGIFWFNQIFCRNLTEQIHISTRHMLSSASAGTLARPWKTASAC